MAISRVTFSGATDGGQIKITGASATDQQTLHTATSTSGTYEEAWLWAYNNATVSGTLFIGVGTATATDNTIKQDIAAQDGLTLVLPGRTIAGGNTIRGYAATANVIYVSGHVNRIAN